MTHPVTMDLRPHVEAFFDGAGNTISCIVRERSSEACAIVGSMTDIDATASPITHTCANAMDAPIRERGRAPDWTIQTHLHVDLHVVAPHIREARDGAQVDGLVEDGDTCTIGTPQAFATVTPDDTPACMAHGTGDAALVGGLPFMPDGGTARADFPGGDSGAPCDPMQKALALPDGMRPFMCHDDRPNGREIRRESTLAGQKAANIRADGDGTREECIRFGTERAATRAMRSRSFPRRR